MCQLYTPGTRPAGRPTPASAPSQCQQVRQRDGDGDGGYLRQRLVETGPPREGAVAPPFGPARPVETVVLPAATDGTLFNTVEVWNHQTHR